MTERRIAPRGPGTRRPRASAPPSVVRRPISVIFGRLGPPNDSGQGNGGSGPMVAEPSPAAHRPALRATPSSFEGDQRARSGRAGYLQPGALAGKGALGLRRAVAKGV